MTQNIGFSGANEVLVVDYSVVVGDPSLKILEMRGQM